MKQEKLYHKDEPTTYPTLVSQLSQQSTTPLNNKILPKNYFLSTFKDNIIVK